MTQTNQVAALAPLLVALKERSGLTYEALARRTGISRSAVHRYCSGKGVPPDFVTLERLGKACAADRTQLLELHRRWAVATAPRPATTAEPDTRAEPAPTPTGATPTEATPTGATPSRATRARWWLPAVAAVVAAAVAAGFLLARDVPTGGPRADNSLLLLSPACPAEVSMGEQDECVREVQRLLAKAGATIAIDGDFGPETLRRVTAFQVLAGLQPRGVVDRPTMDALYAGTTSMATLPPEQVRQLIARVFVEDPARAVRIAKCQSFLDPLYVLPNTNGTRDWGVFQLSDTLLKRYGGTLKQALDPAWNIATAHRAWAQRRDFHDWPYCAAAAN